MARFRTAVLIVPVVAVIGLLASLRESGGTDDAATQAVQNLKPGYQPWAKPAWAPPDSRTEFVLFAFQACAGALALGWVLRKARGGC